MKKNILPLIAATLLGSLLFSSCVDYSESSHSASALTKEYMSFDSPAYKPKNTSNTRIKISTSNQALYVTEGDKVLLATPVTVGYAGASTPHGTYKVLKKEHKRRANTHGWAHDPKSGKYMLTKVSKKPAGWKFTRTAMPYWMEFKNASYGIHTGYVYPYPKSHGCIRVHHNVTPKLFAMIQVGTPIHIATTQPEDSTAGYNMKRPPNPQRIPDNPVLDGSDEIFYYHNPVRFVD